MEIDRKQALQGLETAAIGGAGAALFLALRIPAGAVSGAMLFTATASVAGRELGWPTPLRNALYMLMGFSAGATLTPAAIEAALLWPVSIGVLLVTTGVMWAVGWWVFRRLTPTDPRTAFYATSPGALSAVMILAEQQKADLPKVAVAQSLRLLALVCLSPFAMLAGAPAPPPPGAPPLIGGPVAWGAVFLAVVTGWRLAAKLKWPAPLFLGAMLGSASVHAFGLVHVQAPRPILLVAAAALGAMIGARFRGIRPDTMLRYLPACLGLVLAMVAIAAPVGILVGSLLEVGPVAGLMAFCPGSMEVMVTISLALNAHPAYVAAHHLARTLMLLALVPALSAYWARQERAT